MGNGYVIIVAPSKRKLEDVNMLAVREINYKHVETLQ